MKKKNKKTKKEQQHQSVNCSCKVESVFFFDVVDAILNQVIGCQNQS